MKKSMFCAAIALILLSCKGFAEKMNIAIHADKVIQTIEPTILGANIEDLNFQCYGGLYSQLIHGESFQEHIDPAPIFNLTGDARNHVFVKEVDGVPTLWAYGFRLLRHGNKHGGRWHIGSAREFMGLPASEVDLITAEDLPEDKREEFRQAVAGNRQVSRHWRPIVTGNAEAKFAFERVNPFVGEQSQRITFLSGEGEVGVDNASLHRRGINLVSGKVYEGLLRVKSEGLNFVTVSLGNSNGKLLAEREIRVQPFGTGYQKVSFTMTPSENDPQGSFAVTLKKPGSIVLGYAFLQPGDWGRYEGLSLRKDLVQAILDQGIKVMRYNGSMVNGCPDGHLYKWKEMIGPRDERKPYLGAFNPYASHGFGILEFLDMCEATGFMAIPGVRIDETPEDMIEFVEYAKGSAETVWGKRRIADGHPEPYKLTHIQIGNEEAMSDDYVHRFTVLGDAIWSVDPSIVLLVSQNLNGKKESSVWSIGPNGEMDPLLQRAMKIISFGAQRGGTIWWDCHYDGRFNDLYNNPNNRIACMTNLRNSIKQAFPNYTQFKLAPLEENGGASTMERALAHAQNLHQFMRMGDLPAVGIANTLQADGQVLAWDQGKIYFNASEVWFQPPYYVDQMVYQTWANQLVNIQYDETKNTIDAVARLSENGKMLVLQVTNNTAEAVEAAISVKGFDPDGQAAKVTCIHGNLQDINNYENQTLVTPVKDTWNYKKGSFQFKPYSFTTICWNGK